VTWATSEPILVFIGLSVLDLGPMYVTDRRQTDRRQTADVRRASSLNASALWGCGHNKLCGRPPQYALTPGTLTFDLLTLKVVSESRVTWATSVPILVFPENLMTYIVSSGTLNPSIPYHTFLGHSVLDLSSMYATDRQTSDSIIA